MTKRPEEVESIRQSIKEIDNLLVEMLMRTERRIGFSLGFLVGLGLMALVVVLSA